MVRKFYAASNCRFIRFGQTGCECRGISAAQHDVRDSQRECFRFRTDRFQEEATPVSPFVSKKIKEGDISVAPTKMRIQFCGADRTVTGSCHLIEINGARVLLDCGMYQGKRDIARSMNE